MTSRLRLHVRGTFAVAFSAAAVLAVVAASPVAAQQTFVVTTTADTVDANPGDGVCADTGTACSLRAAVMESNAFAGADAITLASGTYTLTRPGPDTSGDASLGDLDVTESLTIDGAGSETTSIAGGTGLNDRIIEVNFETPQPGEADLDLHVSGVTLTGGSTSSQGGGIYFSAVEAQLALLDVQLRGNSSGASGIAAGGGGAYVRAKAFTLENVVFADNTAFNGGGLKIHPPANASTTMATNLELSRNTAVSNGGGLQADGKLDVSGLVVEDNTAGTSIHNGSGGGLDLLADARLENVQIAGNSANAGGGGVDVSAEITIAGGTISGNTSTNTGAGSPTDGGGIRFHSAPGKLIELIDLVIDGNSAAAGGGAWIFSSQQSSILPGSRVVLERVAVTDNFVQGSGVNNNSVGGILVLLVTNSPAATFVNVTVTGNQGGPWGANSISPSGFGFIGNPTEKPLLRNVTIARNGPGTAFYSLDTTLGARVENTVIGATQGSNCSTSGSWITSLGGNLEQGAPGTCNLGAAVADAKLGQATQDRGTTVIPLLDGSPAIDAANPAPACPPEDQRLIDRPQGPQCDIGAYEVESVSLGFRHRRLRRRRRHRPLGLPSLPGRLVHRTVSLPSRSSGEPPGTSPSPRDYDGDGSSDIAVFRNGHWYVQGQPPYPQIWGQAGDVPVPADYDGDGDADIAVFRNGHWYVKDQPPYPQIWGQAGDVPVPADYDGDGDTDIAVFRNGHWYVKDQPPYPQIWGQAGDVPVPADYDGDGDTDIAVFRNGHWYVKDQPPYPQIWGQAGDVPVPGDYDGNGDADIAVFRDGHWYVKDQPPYPQIWGAVCDIPQPLPYALRSLILRPWVRGRIKQ